MQDDRIRSNRGSAPTRGAAALPEGWLRLQRLAAIGLATSEMAHDLRNLATHVQASAQALQGAEELGAQDRSFLDAVVSGASTIAGISRRIVEHGAGRRESGGQSDLTSAIRRAEPLLRSMVPSAIALELEVAPAAGEVACAPSEIEQILVNLVLNAVQAIGDRPGRIRVAARCEGKNAEIEVQDDGCGIPEELLGRIFSPMVTTRHDGCGLGLAAVRHIARAAGGSASVESRQGQGATFRVLLPTRVAGHRPSPPIVQPTDPTEVLFVDDHLALRRAAVRLLRQLDHGAIAVGTGAEALDLFASNPGRFLMVFLDVGLPDISGADVALQMRAIDRDVRIVLMSGYPPTDRRVRLSEVGPMGFMSKPFDLDDVRNALTQAELSLAPA